MVEYYAGLKEEPLLRQYAMDKYGKYDIQSIKVFDSFRRDPLLQVKYLEYKQYEGNPKIYTTLHDRRIRFSKLPKKYQIHK